MSFLQQLYQSMPDLGVQIFNSPDAGATPSVDNMGFLGKLAYGIKSAQDPNYAINYEKQRMLKSEQDKQSQLAKLAPLAASGNKSALIQLATIDPQAASALAQMAKPSAKVQEIGGKLISYDPSDPTVAPQVIYGDGGKPTVNSDVIKGEGELRKEFEGLQKDFRQVQGGYERLQAAAKNPSAAGDLALIFNYMKILDPGSTVREGEFATAQNAAGIPDIVRNMYNRAKDGERLNPNQRNDFLNQAQGLYGAQLDLFNQGAMKYRGLAEQYGYDPERVTKPIDAPKRRDSKPAASDTPDTREQKLKRLEELRALKAARGK